MKSLALLVTLALSQAIPGKPAPDFTLVNSEGQKTTLSQYKGKTVVLEWLNHGCPFVKKHYNSGNMQGTQKRATNDGVVWLSVISSAPGKQGYSTAKKAEADRKSKGASPTHILLDPKGEVGRKYGAKTTPHMFVVNPKGEVVYAGAIDDKPSADEDDVPIAKNHVLAALRDLKAGKKPAVASTRPYGCSVKY